MSMIRFRRLKRKLKKKSEVRSDGPEVQTDPAGPCPVIPIRSYANPSAASSAPVAMPLRRRSAS